MSELTSPTRPLEEAANMSEPIGWKVTSCLISTSQAEVEEEGVAGMRRVDEPIVNPTWPQVQAFVERLDGKAYTDMAIEGPNRYVMAIGGGPDLFCVSAIGNDMGPYDLLGPEKTDETGKIILGGILTDMPRKYFATKEQALQAAKYFFCHGGVDPALEWQLC